MRSFDITGSGTRYSVPKITIKSEAEAIAEDRERVGSYISCAMDGVSIDETDD